MENNSCNLIPPNLTAQVYNLKPHTLAFKSPKARVHEICKEFVTSLFTTFLAVSASLTLVLMLITEAI